MLPSAKACSFQNLALYADAQQALKRFPEHCLWILPLLKGSHSVHSMTTHVDVQSSAVNPALATCACYNLLEACLLPLQMSDCSVSAIAAEFTKPDWMPPLNIRFAPAVETLDQVLGEQLS